MRIVGLAALLLVGCGPAQAVIDDSSDDLSTNGDDTAVDDTDTTDTNDDPGDTDDQSTDPDMSAWAGARTFHFEDVYGQGPCEDTVEETGTNVTDDIDYNGAKEACADCDEIFSITVSPGTLCEEQTAGQGLPVATEIMRGLDLVGDRDVTVYVIRYDNWNGWSAEPMAEGTLDGADLAYAYDGSVYGAAFTADGTVEF